MIDYHMYRKFHQHAEAFTNFSARRVVPFDKWPQQIEATTSELSPANTLLLPAGIHGFLLKDKRWGASRVPGHYRPYYLSILTCPLVHLLVDNIAPVNWNKEAYDSLVLPPRIKNLVKALVLVRKEGSANVATKSSQQGRRSDLIRGKGGGLIMLLHGGPGTGKTLTAGMQLSSYYFC
jgi:hypothetical protein